MEIKCLNFIEVLNLNAHLVQRVKSRLKMHYYIGLECLVGQCDDNNEYTNVRLE